MDADRTPDETTTEPTEPVADPAEATPAEETETGTKSE